MAYSYEDFYSGLVAEERLDKLGAIQREQGTEEENPEFWANLDEAFDLIKIAADQEGVVLDGDEHIEAAYELVIEDEMEKVAAEHDAIGRAAAHVLFENGITREDLAKMASPMEEAVLANLIADEVYDELMAQYEDEYDEGYGY